MDAPQSTASTILEGALYRTLRALARVALRHGLGVPAFVDIAKRAFVEAARDDFSLPGRKPSDSRISVLTGLTRKEVGRLLAGDAQQMTDEGAQLNRAARVVAGWVRDADFRDAAGNPLPLPFDGSAASFTQLVRRYSGDVPPRAVLDELVRVGSAEREESGLIRLLSRAYIPRVDNREKLLILGTDVADLVSTIDNNLQTNGGTPRFQRKVMYDNLPVEAVAEFRQLSADDAQSLIERMDAWLSVRDRDVNPRVKGTGRVRAGMGIYYFEEDLEGN
jgi:Family of unknown function (DUF6502)